MLPSNGNSVVTICMYVGMKIERCSQRVIAHCKNNSHNSSGSSSSSSYNEDNNYNDAENNNSVDDAVKHSYTYTFSYSNAHLNPGCLSCRYYGLRVARCWSGKLIVVNDDDVGVMWLTKKLKTIKMLVTWLFMFSIFFYSLAFLILLFDFFIS